MKADWEKLKKLAIEAIEETLDELPTPLREQAEELPVTFESIPNLELQADGIERDTLGLFTGAEMADNTSSVLPTQIMLFLDNLWEFAGSDENVFSDEVRTTFMHELGHYFGLDEDDLIERGLE